MRDIDKDKQKNQKRFKQFQTDVRSSSGGGSPTSATALRSNSQLNNDSYL